MTETLYEKDFYSWALRQADLLRHEDYADLDITNLIEEIESMGRSERDALESDLLVVLHHLLKLSCLSNANPSRGWRASVREHRLRIARILRKNPGLKPLVADLISDLYADAYILATGDLAEDNQDDVDLPVHCPWTQEQILDVNYLP